MKRILGTALFFLASIGANAQVSFKPIVRGGLNFSKLSDSNMSYNVTYNSNTGETTSNAPKKAFSTLTNFHLGVGTELKLTKRYALQPELNFSSQGGDRELVYGSNMNQYFFRDYKVSYLGMQIMNKFYLKKFNFQAGPVVDFVVSKNFNVDNEVDIALALGAGYDFTKNFGIELRYKRGLLPVTEVTFANSNGFSYETRNYVNSVFSLGAYYKFDIK